MKHLKAYVITASLIAGITQAAEPRNECSEGTAYAVSGTATIAITSATAVVTDTNVTDPAPGEKARFRLVSTENMYVDFNRGGVASPTATIGDALLVAGVPEYFCLPRATNIGVAAASTSGNLNISRMVR